jgi:hypothetical protein
VLSPLSITQTIETVQKLTDFFQQQTGKRNKTILKNLADTRLVHSGYRDDS